jgi:hypothetical protein
MGRAVQPARGLGIHGQGVCDGQLRRGMTDGLAAARDRSSVLIDETVGSVSVVEDKRPCSYSEKDTVPS